VAIFVLRPHLLPIFTSLFIFSERDFALRARVLFYK
jgi:hypothetical protein